MAADVSKFWRRGDMPKEEALEAITELVMAAQGTGGSMFNAANYLCEQLSNKEMTAESWAHVAGSDLLKNPKIQQRVTALAEKAGLSLDNCFERLGAGLQARRGIVVGKKIHEVPDWTTQVKCAEIGLKVHKAIDAHSEQTNINVLAVGNWDEFAAAYFRAKREP